MPDDSRLPFAAYLRRIDALLRDLPPERRAAIRRELLAHLEDAADEQAANPADPAFQQSVIAALGPGRDLAAAYGVVHGGHARLLRRLALVMAVVGSLLALSVVVPLLGLVAASRFAAPPVALAAAGGFAGAGLHDRRWRGGLALVCMSGLVLLVAGVALFYALPGSRGRLYGAAPLVGGELLLISAALSPALSGLPRRARAAGAALTLLLVSFVSPFSYLPNPLGLYYLVAGGYRYDPAQLLVNRFATVGDDSPAALVAARLDRLISLTGLEPLDLRQPLAGYAVRAVVGSTRFSWPSVAVDLRYADGTTRRYDIPAIDQDYQRQTGIDPLTAPHLPLPGLPAAGPGAPVRLGDPSPVPLPDSARRLVSAWLGSQRAADLAWAPDGRALLLRSDGASPVSGDASQGLWLLPLDGAAPRLLAEQATSATWSADGRFVVALQWRGPANGPVWWRTIAAHDLASGTVRIVGATDREQVSVVGDAVYFLDGGALWRGPLDGRPSERLAILPDAGAILDAAPLAVSPDQQRVAYGCASDLCLAELDGHLLARVSLGYQAPSPLPVAGAPDAPVAPKPTALPVERDLPYLWSFGLVWSPDGQRLAVTTAATDQRGRPSLRLLGRDGQIMRELALGPDGALDPPQWAPDSRLLLLTAYPSGGRRIVAVDTTSGAVLDLSRPRWDAFARLAPDGRRVLVWNGRGGLWLAPLLVEP